MGKIKTEINIENLNSGKKISRSEVQRVALLSAGRVCKKSCEVNIVFVTDRKLRALNRKYLGKNSVTDVLAFPGEGFVENRSGVGSKRDSCFLGDIAISSDRAARNADLYGVTFKEEIARYVAHGILHLGGYDDKTRAGKERMRKKEDEILRESREKVRQ